MLTENGLSAILRFRRIWTDELVPAASCPSRSQVNFVDDCAVFHEIVERGNAVQAAYAALLVAAFFGFVVYDGPIIDPDRAGLELSRDPQRTVDVSRPDRRGKAVLGLV